MGRHESHRRTEYKVSRLPQNTVSFQLQYQKAKQHTPSVLPEAEGRLVTFKIKMDSDGFPFSWEMVALYFFCSPTTKDRRVRGRGEEEESRVNYHKPFLSNVEVQLKLLFFDVGSCSKRI